MFTNRTVLLRRNAPLLHYGVAVTDVDGDGAFEFVAAGYGGPNQALKWDGSHLVDVATPALADVGRQAIGLAAGDLDGDGREEIYILNTDSFAGAKRFGDRLFAWRDDEWIDLFSLPLNRSALNLTAGRSVAAVDRRGRGRYGFFVVNYGGPMRFYELDEDGRLVDVAPDAGVDLVTGGRSVVSLPLVSQMMDVLAANENGPNFLFRNLGDGTFVEVAQQWGLADPQEAARGLATFDADGDGRFDVACGNWEGPHRMFVRGPQGRFCDLAPGPIAQPSRVRTVVAADFDNDGHEELFFNNLGQPNRLFGWRRGLWAQLNIGEAAEPHGLGTGAAVADLDGDGRLELLIAHGESAAQPLTYYHTPRTDNHWLRIRPLTSAGAPARGAVVVLRQPGRTQIRSIDAGSGYLCQMEPVAHFGLGAETILEAVEVRWPDGATVKLDGPKIDALYTVEHP